MFKRARQPISNEKTQQKPLLVWPGVVIVLLQWLVKFGVPVIAPEAMGIPLLGVVISGIAIIIWWAFFSRAPRFERWSAILLMVVAMAATTRILDDSIAKAQVGLTFFIYGIPILCLAFVVWAVVSRNLSERLRRITMAATILLASGVWALVRTEGMTSDIGHEFAWRWKETPEERLLERSGSEPSALPSALSEMETGISSHGFRGPHRNSILKGVKIGTDWSTAPPREMWRRPAGPGWSSFAVQGDLIITQEQLGDYESVTCYNIKNGSLVWKHGDEARFLGADANPGPRATPTLFKDRVYTFGATGILNALNIFDGSVVWSRNAVSDAGKKVPIWGYASSPLVVENAVVIHVTDTLIAYNPDTGDPLWFGAVGTGYSSPHLFTIDGITQILFLSGTGATSFDPEDGQILWEHGWEQEERILQPALIPDNDILMSAVLKGLRRITVKLGPQGWTAEEQWTSTQLKSNFNDLVVHKGHAYGFDGPNLACIDIRDGTRKWKGGRYGGQLMLLADQDLLLVLSEKGKLALISAVPDQFTELAGFQALEGKTWNHPVLADNLLLVRNGQEMAAFRLPL